MAEAVRKVSKPALVYKVLAAGRKCDSEDQKREAIAWAYKNIKPIDATIIGLYPRYSDQVTETIKMEVCDIEVRSGEFSFFCAILLSVYRCSDRRFHA